MKTKEQILEKYYSQNVGLNTFKFNQVIEAMDEYAKQYGYKLEDMWTCWQVSKNQHKAGGKPFSEFIKSLKK